MKVQITPNMPHASPMTAALLHRTSLIFQSKGKRTVQFSLFGMRPFYLSKRNVLNWPRSKVRTSSTKSCHRLKFQSMLKEGKSEISFVVQSATVMFVNIVNFSGFFSDLSPQQIMGTLSTLFG